MVEVTRREHPLLGHVVTPRRTLSSVADQGEFELLNVGEVHVLRVGVVVVLNRAGMEHGGGDLLSHDLREHLFHHFHWFAMGAHSVCGMRVQG